MVTWQGREVEQSADPSNHGDNQLDCGREVSTEIIIKERIRGHVKFCSSGEPPLCLNVFIHMTTLVIASALRN